MTVRFFPSAATIMVAFGLCLTFVNPSCADIDFESAIFQNTLITQNDTDGYAITTDVVEGGTVAGRMSVSLDYGGGTTPFDSGDRWRAVSNAFRIYGDSTGTFAGDDTADGVWQISVTPNAGWQVDGISIFTNLTTIANPNFANISSNGVGSLFDDNNLVANFADGDSVPNGSTIDFNGQTGGIPSADHSRRWAYNAAGASDVNFRYEAGMDEVVATVGVEAIHVSVQMSVISVPEPASASIVLMAMSTLTLRRRRK